MKNTFSYDVKHEILKVRYDASCCAQSSLCAIFQTLGEVVLTRAGLTLSIAIDHEDMFEFVVQTIEKFYGEIAGRAEIHDTKHMGSTRHEIVFKTELGRQLLFDTGIVSIENGTTNINKGIEHSLIIGDCCKVAYLSHAFAGAGSITLPTTEKSGYHMEWALSSEQTANSIMELLAEFDVFPKMVVRGDKFIVYLKDRDVISDLIGRFGANKAMLKMAEMSLERDIRNRLNRDANCAAANISKTVDASAKQLAAINVICDTIGLDGISAPLREIAKARIADTQASLAMLAQMLGISKSAARARLDSLIAISENLK